MPRYEYECPKCGAETERDAKVDERNDQYCEECEGERLELVLSVTARMVENWKF